MDTWVQLVLTAVTSITASTGFWAYLQRKDETKTATSQLLMGLAYNRLVTLGVEYIRRGWITQDEFEEYEKFYFKPYKSLGGNGAAERVMNAVKSLPFSSKSKYDDILNRRNNEEFINNVRVIPAPDSDRPAQEASVE